MATWIFTCNLSDIHHFVKTYRCEVYHSGYCIFGALVVSLFVWEPYIAVVVCTAILIE